jgi:hypothetical protein
VLSHGGCLGQVDVAVEEGLTRCREPIGKIEGECEPDVGGAAGQSQPGGDLVPRELADPPAGLVRGVRTGPAASELDQNV